jgi:isoleucyl-tRNA synthetase
VSIVLLLTAAAAAAACFICMQGWDCHGLPIEVKALELLKSSSSSNSSDPSTLSAPEIRRLARDFAAAAIEEQRQSFKRWGVMADWDRPYITMDPKYEAAQLAVFATMVERGLIYRGLKPVYWSPVSRTALAEAELEYVDDHVSPSLYVSFPLSTLSASAVSAGMDKFPGLKALVWTTTPWTLPGNLAISFHKDLEYCVVKVGTKKTTTVPAAATVTKDKPQSKGGKDASEEGAGVEGAFYLIGKDRIADVIGGVLQREAEVVFTVKGEVLAGCVAMHPFYSRPSPLISGAHVTIESGTALVHTAPAHGMDDFQVCKEHGINEVLCPVDAEGTYTADVLLPELAGQNVLKGANKHVVAVLKSRDNLVHVSKLVHRFPYDWRSKTPVIQRATEQWFCRLEAIQAQALDALKQVELIPASGRQRLQAMIEGRKEWCISRQRHWGVPIPVFYNTKDNSPLLTAASVHHIQQLVAQHGTDCWWTMPVEELLAPEHRNDGHTYVRGVDTMDVWFDSGCSWRAVVQAQMGHPADKQADVYLEGSDQHRGWFQSSLLTSVAATNRAPYKTILTRRQQHN